MVRVWYRNLKGLSLGRKLSAMYLVNDVVQNSRKKVETNLLGRQKNTIFTDLFSTFLFY